MTEAFSLGPARSDALAMLDFSTLLEGAARLRPERNAIIARDTDTSEPLTFLRLHEQTGALARSWHELGMSAGERVLIVSDGSAAALIALFGALRAGLDAAVAGAHLSAEELANFARQNGVAAIAAQGRIHDLDLGETILAAAASCERVRLIVALDRDGFDGAVRLDPLSLEPGALPPCREAHHARVITRDMHGRSFLHRQRALVAAALDFVTRAQIGGQTPLLSTLVPVSFAGLVAGPIAGLGAGAPLVLHAPLDAARLMDMIGAAGPVHLVAPAALAQDVSASRLLAPHAVATFILMSRVDALSAEFKSEPPEGRLMTMVPVIDLYAIGEIAAITEQRLGDGRRAEPLALQHLLNLDGHDVVAARRVLGYPAGEGREPAVVTLEGAAISQNQ